MDSITSDTNTETYEGYYLDRDRYYKPNDLTPSQKELLKSAANEAKEERYDRVVSLLTELLDSIEAPSGFHKLVFSEIYEGENSDFIHLLDILFQKSWNQFQTLIPKLEEHFICKSVGRNYFAITYELDESRPFGSTHTLTRDLTGYSFQEGLEILATIPYEDHNDVLLDYLEFAKEHHPTHIDACIEAALKRVEFENIKLTSSNEDALVEFYLERAEEEPERAYEWIGKAEKRLESLTPVYYTYHHCALYIALFYQKKQDSANVERMVDLIYKNINGVEHEGQKNNLLNLLSHYPEFVRN
ncbi:MAG: hypothetical protein H7A41_02340 [Chlamydiales bacterium]|nr:hypothetical protein [Chlamydiales bacterium]